MNFVKIYAIITIYSEIDINIFGTKSIPFVPAFFVQIFHKNSRI